MNIVLNIGGQDVEVDKSFDFAITKTFEELQNPTTINNDWSKTLSIPMTNANNNLFGNIFDVDRQLVFNDGTHENIGVYFNPTKKANFTLYYNSGVMMTGYAKLSAVDNVKKMYEVNLFGEIGNTFLELLNCTFNENADVEAQYIMPNYLSENLKLTKELVKASWDNDNPKISLDDEELTDTDIIGFTPTSCGLPANFDAKNVVDEYGNFNSIAEIIDIIKSTTLGKDVKVGETLVGDGLTERQWGEFRVWNQKPYIYVNKLWQMFVKKSQEICKYPLRLDKSWFNSTNPYYRDLIYMCNDFEGGERDMIEVENKDYFPIPNAGKRMFHVANFPSADEYVILPILTGINFNDFSNEVYHKDDRHYYEKYYALNPNCYLRVDLTDRISTYSYAVRTNITTYEEDMGEDVFTDNSLEQVVVQPINFRGELGFYMALKLPAGADFTDFDVITEFKYRNKKIERGYANPYCIYQRKMNGIWENFINIYRYVNKYNHIATSQYDIPVYSIDKYLINFAKIMDKDTKPFQILLNYAKMFGLMFIVNQRERCIDVTSRNVYFRGYKIIDWTDKVNTLNKYKIEQPTFDCKYINFNYDEVEGDNYKNYFDKYKIALGGKRLITEYDFNNDEQNLFEGIQPTNIVNEKITTIRDMLFSWGGPGYAMPRELNMEVYFDNKNGGESANIYSAFAFRCDNQPVAVIGHDPSTVNITEDTEYEIGADTYCFHGLDSGFDDYKITTNTLPLISFIDRSGKFGCTFNLPSQITFYPEVMPYEEAVFVYDNFWREYINERYNTSNKKVILQVNLSPLDFANFEFNNFVKIGNKLYIVNQIKDYGVENGQNTEVELISISDINGYTAGTTFHYAYFTKDEIDVPFTGGTNTTTITMQIEATEEWHLSSPSRGAVTFSKTSGTHDDQIDIIITPLRTGSNAREITVNILNSSNEVVDVLIINQYRSN